MNFNHHIKRSKISMDVVLVVAGILIVLIGLSLPILNAQHEERRTCTVSKAPEAVTRGDGVERRVYTDDCGVLSVSDMLFAGHFSSGDTWNDVVGETGTFEFTTRGYRVPLFSMFPVIIEVEKVSE